MNNGTTPFEGPVESVLQHDAGSTMGSDAVSDSLIENFPTPFFTVVTTDGDRDRIETRKIAVSAVRPAAIGLPHARQLACVERIVEWPKKTNLPGNAHGMLPVMINKHSAIRRFCLKFVTTHSLLHAI